MTSSRNFIIVDEKNLANGRCSLSNDTEFRNCILVSAFKAEFVIFHYSPLLASNEQRRALVIDNNAYSTGSMSGSTLIASQLPIKDWHAFIGDPTIADAVCDRLFHVAHKFELKGGSMRKKTELID